MGAWDLSALLGLAMIAVGVALIYVPAALIVVGGLAVALSINASGESE